MVEELPTGYYLENFNFHSATAKITNFCSEDLGAFYLDIIKDRLYITPQKSRMRRSAQTSLWHITHTLIKLIYPLLPFTAYESWEVFLEQTNCKNSSPLFSQKWTKLPNIEKKEIFFFVMEM